MAVRSKMGSSALIMDFNYQDDMSFLGNLYKPSFATVTGGVWNG